MNAGNGRIRCVTTDERDGRHVVRERARGAPMAALVLGLLILASPPLRAQNPVFDPNPALSASLWGAGVVDGERSLGLSPQVGLRVEGTLEGRVWLGVDLSGSWLLTRPVDLADLRSPSCDCSRGDFTGAFTAQLRIELPAGPAHPYAAVLVGEKEHESRDWGIALGARLPNLVSDEFDLHLEGRFRKVGLSPNDREDRFEIRVGIGVSGG